MLPIWLYPTTTTKVGKMHTTLNEVKIISDKAEKLAKQAKNLEAHNRAVADGLAAQQKLLGDTLKQMMGF